MTENSGTVRILVIFIVVVIAAIWYWRSRSANPSNSSTAGSWKTFAAQVQGQYSENPLQFHKQVDMQSGQWHLILEQSSTVDYSPADSTHTTMWVAFMPRSSFELSLQARKGKPVIQLPQSAGDIVTTGNAALDMQYEIRSTQPDQARSLLGDRAISDALLAQPTGTLQVAPKVNALNQPDGSGQWQISYSSEESISDVQRLLTIRQLLLVLLAQLAK